MVTFAFRHRFEFRDFGTRYRKLMERISFGRAAWRHLIEANYDTVIVTKPFDFPALWWAKRQGMHARILFHSGGTDFFLGDRWFAGAIDNWAACSGYTARQVGRHFRRSNVRVVSNGVDTRAFAPAAADPALRTHWQVPATAPVIMSVGRLVGWKGLRVIIEAIAQIPEAYYVVVGEGDDRARLEQQAATHGVRDRVHFVGRVAHEQLPALMRCADVFVQPSVGEEAFGITVIEAMACGLPVVASRNGGMPEIIADGETGVLLPVGDVAAWRAALRELLGDRARRAAIGRRAREYVERRYTWDAAAEEVERLFLHHRA